MNRSATRSTGSKAHRSRARRALTALAALVLIGALASVWLEARRRNGLYWYDVHRDYDYRFRSATAVAVELDGRGLSHGAVSGGWDTALLRLEVAATPAGWWFEPQIEVERPRERPLRQYFERGARGVRYVNLGDRFAGEATAAGTIGLRGRNLRWPEQRAELLLFRNVPVDGRRLLIVAPHPDDAEIAAFGLYAFRDADIVTITAGNYVDGSLAHLYDDEREQSLAKGRLRSWDSVAVPLWGGVPPSRSINLGYFNNQLQRMRDAPTAVAVDELLEADAIRRFRRWNASGLLDDRAPASTWESLVDDLVALVERAEPEIIVAPHPILDRSSDHRCATLALFDALDRLEPAGRLLYLYTNHHVGTEYYPFGPADGWVSPGPWFDPAFPFAGLYSHPIDERSRLDKLFALEAMHDLRPAPRYVSSRPLTRIGNALAELWRDPVDSYSYFRRAPRPNELFFVYAAEDRAALRAAVEARKAQPASSY